MREIAVEARLGPGPTAGSSTTFRYPGSIETERLHDTQGVLLGRRGARDLAAVGPGQHRVHARCPERLHRVTARIENRSDFSGLEGPREEAMRASLLGAHLLLAVEGGRFLSLVDPPPFAEGAAKACKNLGLFPVLVQGEQRPALQDSPDVLLASPIILARPPAHRPRKPGDFYDACEIDELLTLRTMTLTDVEKREARATDDARRRHPGSGRGQRRRHDGRHLADTLARLHGTFRDIPVASRFPPGARVRLRPGPRRTDAQDMFLRGLTARVEAIMQDVDGRDCLAVTVDADPATDLYRAQGRYLYFYEDEVEAP